MNTYIYDMGSDPELIHISLPQYTSLEGEFAPQKLTEKEVNARKLRDLRKLKAKLEEVMKRINSEMEKEGIKYYMLNERHDY